MKRKRRKHSPEFKAKVALEALQGIKILSEIAQQYEIHPVMIGNYKDHRNRCDNRIISISQPHVRPIVRGKAGEKLKCGAKISESMTDGLLFIDHIGWDSFWW